MPTQRLSAAALILLMLWTCQGNAQRTVLFQEDFNCDGDGRCYFLEGRGFARLEVGPGMWEHSFLVDQIGLPAKAPARRAAILSSHLIQQTEFTSQHLVIWDALINWMLNGKERATILWIPGHLEPASSFLASRMMAAGHTNQAFNGSSLPSASSVDLVIHTSAGGLDPPTALVAYPVPVIAFNSTNHDDTLISSIGTVTAVNPPQIHVVDSNKDHPVLTGLTGTIPWVNSVVALQGIGIDVPAESKVLARYLDPATNLELPALVVLEAGADLLGAFNPSPTCSRYIVGADLNEAFGNQQLPRGLQLKPVRVSGCRDVQLAVSLAATNVDFESSDFLRILYSNADESSFTLLTEFRGIDDPTDANAKALSNGEVVLGPNKFTDVTFDIPAEVTTLTVRIEAFNTFPNEVVAIDNVRITAAGGRRFTTRHWRPIRRRPILFFRSPRR